MSWDLAADIGAGVCLVLGAFLAFAAGVGVLRFPDLLARMHAGTKPQVLGLILVLIGLSLRLRSGSAVWALVLVAAFQMLTAPVAAHMVGRAGYRMGNVRSDLLVVDELTTAQDEATSRAAGAAGRGVAEPGGEGPGEATTRGEGTDARPEV